MNWFLLALKRTFTFKGRARRKEYGWFIFISLFIHFVFIVLELSTATLDFAMLTLGIFVLETIWGIWYSIAAIALTTRRLHDLGYSGWWQLLPLFALLFSAILATAVDEPTFMIAILIIFIVLYLIYSLWLLFKEGQCFENKYGIDPRSS